MKERPIIFNGDMVRAILDGRKTQTRRLVKPSLIQSERLPLETSKGVFKFWCADEVSSPFGNIGERLWVRESFWNLCEIQPESDYDEYRRYYTNDVQYVADATETPSTNLHLKKWIKRPSIHMPRTACRIILEITNVRVERLQDISKEDAKAEGFDCQPAPNMNFKIGARHNFLFAWDQIYGDRKENPWVWVIEFKVLTTNGQIPQEAA